MYQLAFVVSYELLLATGKRVRQCIAHVVAVKTWLCYNLTTQYYNLTWQLNSNWVYADSGGAKSTIEFGQGWVVATLFDCWSVTMHHLSRFIVNLKSWLNLQRQHLLQWSITDPSLVWDKRGMTTFDFGLHYIIYADRKKLIIKSWIKVNISK